MATGGETTFGIGVQVHVEEPAQPTADSFRGEPTGIIVDAARSYPMGSLIPQRFSGRVWVIAFDEAQYLPDGRGPIERAEIPEALLVAAPEL